MTKLIKFNDQYTSTIEPIESSEIIKEYNLYGLFYKNESYEENIKEYKKERNEFIADLLEEEGKTSLTYNEASEAIVKFVEDFYYIDSKGQDHEGEPLRFIESTDEEYTTNIEGYYYDEKGEWEVEADEEGILDDRTNTYVSYWDGSNFKKQYIEPAEGWADTEDITDQWLESFEGKKFIGSTKGNNSTTWFEYYYDTGKKVIWEKSVSLWQGSGNDTWNIIEDEEDIDVLFVKWGSDEIDNLRTEIRESHGHNLEVIENREEDYPCTEYYHHSPSQMYEIFSQDNAESLGSWVNDPYQRTAGGEFFKLRDGRIINYSWSAYQGSWEGYEESILSEEEVINQIEEN